MLMPSFVSYRRQVPSLDAVATLEQSAEKSSDHTPRLCPVRSAALVAPVGAPSFPPGVRLAPSSTRHSFTSEACVAHAKNCPSAVRHSEVGVTD